MFAVVVTRKNRRSHYIETWQRYSTHVKQVQAERKEHKDKRVCNFLDISTGGTSIHSVAVLLSPEHACLACGPALYSWTKVGNFFVILDMLPFRIY
jgi:hypothetical protein